MINMIIFGGMSECGKSYACKFLAKNGFHHQKIIFFEKQVMKQFDIDPFSKECETFEKLYQNNNEYVFELFEEEILEYCNKKHCFGFNYTIRYG